MSLFNLNEEEILTFFAVLVRFSVLMSVLPIVGDRFVPGLAKIFLAVAVTLALFPALVNHGFVRPGEAQLWGATAGGILGTIAVEAIFALILGFTARLAFDAIFAGGNLMGNFMGFAMASTYDPSQNSQTQVTAEIQMALATLLFLAIDGHHIVLRGALSSYQVVGVGGLGLGSGLNGAVSQRLLEISGIVVRTAIQLSAPVAFAIFGVNVAFGVMSKAMPQLNILILSMAVSAVVGLLVMFLSLGEFQSVAGDLFARVGEWMDAVMLAIAKGK
ncbi:MAG: flagellar biosynthetic protein FliR [Oligoflexia bacterium]|nr:flagellar biosynthetic protein FliR [Oligoflexia bacterium]